MSIVRREARRRWTTVAAVIVALVATPLIIAAAPVDAAPVAPGVLRERVLASARQPFQGYVETRGSIILPRLPQLGDIADLLGGTTSMRAWYSGPHSWRVAVLDPVGEKDTYGTGGNTYTWDYGRNLWTEIVGDPPVRLPRAADLVPPELGRRLLADAAPGDRLEALPAQRIAGVAAAGLWVTAADPDTTLGRFDVWADPVTGVPLRVDVAGAFTSRFLDVTLHSPDPAILVPQAAGSSAFVSTDRPDVISALNTVAGASLPGTLAGRPRAAGPVSAIAVYGTGLSRFVVVAIPGRLGQGFLNAVRDVGAATTAGGYAVQSAGLTVEVTRPARRTYLLIGFVSADLLTRAAGELR